MITRTPYPLFLSGCIDGGFSISLEIQRQHCTLLLMDKSNIFVYIELSKLAANLTADIELSKQRLKSQVGYFKIIPGKYFSDTLRPEWDSIVSQIHQKDPAQSDSGRGKAHALVNTIDRMTPEQCVDMSLRVLSLYRKIQQELELPN